MFATLRKYFSPIAHPEEELCFVQIFKPLYILLAALGLFPRTIEFPNGIQNTFIVFTHSLVNSACTLFMVVVIHTFFVFHLQELSVASSNNSMTEDELTLTNYTTDLVAQILFCTVSYFQVIRYRTLYITLLNNMAECWDGLAAGKRRQILGRLRVQVNCAVLGSLLVISIVLAVVTYTGFASVWKIVLITLTFFLPEIIQFTMIAFYFVMILMIIALLQNINEEFRVIMHVKNNVDDSFKAEAFGACISQIKIIYVKTMEMKRQINAVFQAPILVAIAVSFHELVSMPHMMYHGLSFQSNFSTHDVIECSCWVINQLLKMYTLALSGALLKPQVNKIARTIHNIPIKGDQDYKLYLQVHHFSTLMTVQDPTITVYGYFPLDATLIFNILASAAMYLVILVQFDKPKENLN